MTSSGAGAASFRRSPGIGDGSVSHPARSKLTSVEIPDSFGAGAAFTGHVVQGGTMRTSQDLVELMRRVALRDRSAFEELYRATSAKLFGIALRILRRHDLAEEALQDTYAKIWDRAADFDPDRASPITWMGTIIRYRALDDVRRKAMISLEDLPAGFDIEDDQPDPLAARQRSDELRQLLACLDKLEPKHRTMVLLAYYHGTSRETLAARFDAPVATVKTWLRRSLARLRECLST